MERKTHNLFANQGTRKQSLFAAVDTDNSGQIDKAEFGKLYDLIKLEVNAELAKEAELKKDATRTLPHARCVTPMRFHRVPRASAPSHHASWWRAPPSAAASRRVCGSASPRSGGPELPCDPSHLPSVHDMGSFFSRPVLIFRTILNRETNGFVTAVSRVLLGGKKQT